MRVRALPRLALVLAALSGLPGCSMALPSLWERTNTSPPAPAQAAAPAAVPAAAVETTGSVRRPQETAEARAPSPLPIPQADWEAARRVLMQTLEERADTPSQPWENPQSGMRGTVTVLQRANGAAGRVCRDFLGSAIKDGKELWFDGKACRASGPWDVVELRPWRRG